MTGQQREGPHAVTVRSVYRMAGAALPAMIAAGGGPAMPTRPARPWAAPPDGGLHLPTRDAAHSFARAIAVALRDRGIRCNAVCPRVTGPCTG